LTSSIAASASSPGVMAGSESMTSMSHARDSNHFSATPNARSVMFSLTTITRSVVDAAHLGVVGVVPLGRDPHRGELGVVAWLAAMVWSRRGLARTLQPDDLVPLVDRPATTESDVERERARGDAVGLHDLAGEQDGPWPEPATVLRRWSLISAMTLRASGVEWHVRGSDVVSALAMARMWSVVVGGL
jgi:hypothetical protein